MSTGVSRRREKLVKTYRRLIWVMRVAGVFLVVSAFLGGFLQWLVGFAAALAMGLAMGWREGFNAGVNS